MGEAKRRGQAREQAEEAIDLVHNRLIAHHNRERIQAALDAIGAGPGAEMTIADRVVLSAQILAGALALVSDAQRPFYIAGMVSLTKQMAAQADLHAPGQG